MEPQYRESLNTECICNALWMLPTSPSGAEMKGALVIEGECFQPVLGINCCPNGPGPVE